MKILLMTIMVSLFSSIAVAKGPVSLSQFSIELNKDIQAKSIGGSDTKSNTFLLKKKVVMPPTLLERISRRPASTPVVHTAEYLQDPSKLQEW